LLSIIALQNSNVISISMDQSNHKKFMSQAMLQARKAYERAEVPVGAIIVDQNGKVLAQAYNRVESTHTQSAHAEFLAIIKASKKIGNWRLSGCTLYVTLEPCAMCMNFIILSRLSGVVFGAASPLFGYHRVDDGISSWLYKKDGFDILGGIKSDESSILMKQFFKNKRSSSSE
jgi:tRNA(adenine34) deaminase